MNKKEALKILGLHNYSSAEEVKKKYRLIIKQIHPDITDSHDYPYEISEINAAYELLMSTYRNEEVGERHCSSETNAKRSKRVRWNAPVNQSAFCERNIYHNVEDADGMIIGQAVIDSGKYLWTADEEFGLFMKSLYECSKKIIAEDDDNSGRDRANDILLQAEITYLLAGQFVDSNMIFNSSSIVGKIGDNTYLADAMVEGIDSSIRFKEGELLIPYRIAGHKLYVGNDKGKEVGYLSFRDDRLYYVVIPLFERRAVLIKIQVSDSKAKIQRGRRYIEVSLMLRLKVEEDNRVAESINNKILNLLQV